MPALYLTEQQSKIRLSNQRLQVEREVSPFHADQVEVLLSLPLAHVDSLILLGNISLTTPAIHALLRRGVPVVFLSAQGEYLGRLEGELSPHVPLRKMQYLRHSEENFVLEMARRFVRAKLAHQRAMLQRYQRTHPGISLCDFIQALDRFLAELERKTTLSALRGLEGTATAAYFRAVRTLLHHDWGFTERNRRPPRDPVNVLLSFGYTLLAEACRGAVEAVGLDPYLGFLHEVAYNRPSLALDLMEEFRPVIDGLVLWALNGGQIKPEDFLPGTAERPILLSREGQRRFLAAYEARMEMRVKHPLRQMQFPLRQCLVEQAHQVASCIQRGVPDFQGMGFR